MVDLNDIQQAARIATDEQGRPVVQIPLDLWEEWLAAQQRLPQHERIRAALAAWDASAAGLSEDWWDEFQAFLRANRLDLS